MTVAGKGGIGTNQGVFRDSEPPDSAFPRLRELLPERHQQLGVVYAYIRAARVTRFTREGWRVNHRVQPFEVEGEAYMLLERGDGMKMPAAFNHKVLVETSSSEEAAPKEIPS